MFVFNMKINGNRISKIFIGTLICILLLVTIYICYKLIFNNKFSFPSDEINGNTIFEITPQNYTNVLENVHKNPGVYIGQKIKFSGYIYKLYDFSDNQFVLARNMVISSDFKTVVVGFLCESNLAINYAEGTWVEITGTIKKGNYNGSIPIVEVKYMEKIDPPSEEYVYPPDSSFVTTSTIL